MKEGLSIILPAYNEEDNIKNVISEVISYMRRFVNDFEVLVVNDGSDDLTLKKIKEMEILYPELKVISYERNKGYGFAIREGIKYSEKEWVFIMDADNQFQISDFGRFWENKNSYDFILGYRKQRADNIYRIILAKLGNFVADLILGKRIKDINCGFKLFKSEDLKRLSLCSKGGAISFEILYQLFKLNNKNKFLQLPVLHYERKRGKQTGGRWGIIIRLIMDGIKVVFRGKAFVQK